MNFLNRLRFSLPAGWWVVADYFVITIITAGIVSMSFTAFFDPIAEGLNWSATIVSTASSIRGFQLGLLAPLVGILIDRWGPRPLVFWGIVITGVSMLLLSNVHSIGIFYFCFIMQSIGMSGPSPTVSATTMANWFPNKLGLTMGIIGSGFSLGGLLVPLVVKLIEATDWRKAFFILGIALMALCLPLSLPLRFRKEKHSPQPEGKADPVPPAGQAPAPVAVYPADMSLKQALRNRAFWHIVIAMFVFHAVTSTVSTHIMTYLDTLHFTRTTASFVVSAAALVSIVGRLGAGWVSDRYNSKMVSVVGFALFFLGMTFLNYTTVELTWIIILHVIFYGLGWGALFTMKASLVQDYFGRSSYGSIYGFMQGIMVLSLLAPIFGGWVKDTWNNYDLAWQTYMVSAFIAVIIMITLPSVGRAGKDNNAVNTVLTG